MLLPDDDRLLLAATNAATEGASVGVNDALIDVSSLR